MIPIDMARLHDDLAGLVEGELLLDDWSRALYSTDASPFEVRPAGVVRPKHEADVQAVVRYASEHGIPLTARGAGTGQAGAALGPGLVLDFSRHMRRIVNVSDGWARIEPGATWAEVNRALAPLGRRLAIEPADVPTATMGGLVASDIAGHRVAAFGRPHDHLLACRCVIDTGDVVSLAQVPRVPPEDYPDRFRRMHRSAIELLDRHSPTINAERRAHWPQHCGYRLEALTPEHFDYPRLLAGSEGTLALLTELTVRTRPVAEGRAVLIFGFEEIETALRAAEPLLARQPTACVLLDHRLLSLIRAQTEPFGKLLPAEVGAAIVVEFESEAPAAAQASAREVMDEVVRAGARISLAGAVPHEADRLWRLVDAAMPSLVNLRGGPSASLGIEDIGVPPERIGEFLRAFHEVLLQHETTAPFLVNLNLGQVHARPFVDTTDEIEAAKLWAIAEETYSAALALGGTISVGHGIGLARTPWIAKQYPSLTAVFRELKTIFDPRHIFNPGNIVGPDPARPAWPMRFPLRKEPPPVSPPAPAVNGAAVALPGAEATELLLWKPEEIRAQTAACNGCGACRAETAPERMCPVFRATHAEEATPRAKANLLRELLRQGANGVRMSDAAVRSVANLCVNCKMCASECPSHVDIPKLMLQAKAANVAEYGLDRADWVMTRLRFFSACGSSFALLANRLLHGPITRWFMEKFFGVSRRRRLPPFAHRSFLRQAKRWGWTTKPGVRRQASGVRSQTRPVLIPDKIALFVDIFANYHDPTIAEAAVRVLQHNGITVHVPAEQTSCGMEALSQGDVETAREAALKNIRVLVDLVRDGYTVVCPEPTAALALTHDYLHLLDDSDVRLVAANTMELTAYLNERRLRGQLRTDFQPLDLALGHHVPCHLRALGRVAAAPALLRLIPGLRVHEIDEGCSGMAGTFGLRAEHYETSLTAGRPLFEALARPRIQFGATECSSCRLQMEEGAGKRTLHPVQYLAMGYGLMPQLARRLLTPISGLVVE